MRLFSIRERTDSSAAGEAESSYAFLDRAAGKPWARVRELLEKWFGDYPDEAKLGLGRRFQSDRWEQHVGAWWELYLYTVLSRLDCRVTPEPALDTGRGRPDFLVECNAESFYLEATAFASGIVDEGRDEKREAVMFEIVNQATSANFHVGIEFDRVGTEQPKVAEVVEPLERWLAELDPDQVTAEVLADQPHPEYPLVVRDWRIRFTAFPIKSDRRGTAERILGMYPPSSGWVNDRDKARAALERKRRRYRELDRPLVVALLSTSGFFDDDDVAGALYGNIGVQYMENDPTYEARWVRLRDGFWMGDRGPEAGTVSAVLHADGLLPWVAGQRLPRLWLNPWAERPIEWRGGLATGLATDRGEIETGETDHKPWQLLGLDSSWPGFGSDS